MTLSSLIGFLAFVLLLGRVGVAVGAESAAAPLPPLEVAAGLPSHERCRDASDLACANYRRIAEWYGCGGNDGLPLPAANAYRAWTVWDLAKRATDPGEDEAGRRKAIRDLVGLCGWRSVLTGQLPPPVPPWE